MKILYHTILWNPPNQPKRLETLKKHLNYIKTYEGDFDILVSWNEYRDTEDSKELLSILDEIKDIHKVDIRFWEENKGWEHGRNTAIKKTVEDSYDLLIMSDCDVFVEHSNWISKVAEASNVLPAFMCRMREPQYMKGGKIKYLGLTLELYDEWLGMINVIKRSVIDKVGGYDNVTFPGWGFGDCYYGRQLKAAGYLKAFNGYYPSLSNLGVQEEHNDEYDISLKSMKDEVGNKYAGIFWENTNKMLTGQLPCYVDYTIGQ